MEQAPVMRVRDWLLVGVLMCIPLVNIILLFVWAFGNGANPNKANYAKASLLFALIIVVLYIIIFVAILGTVGSSLH